MRQTYKLISNVQNHFRGLQSTSENIVIDYQIDTKSSGGNIFGSIFHQIDYVNVAKSCFFQVPLGGASRVKLYLIKEFQRLKEEENRQKSPDWSLQRTLAKINYRIHNDAIKENLIPSLV